jgi:SAM-dependent methyltransferase
MPADLEDRQAREQSFHDRWAAEVDIEALNPRQIATCPTTPETLHALALLNDISGKSVLEIGCGHGELTAWLAQLGARLTTRDLSPGMVDVSRKLCRRLGLEEKIQFDIGPGEKLEYDESSFDIVFGHDVLHHMDLNSAGSEIRRVLKPGGRAVFAEPLGHNPVLNYFREESPETRTPDEKPLLFADFKILGSGFSRVRHKEFHLFTMALYLWFKWGERLDPNKVRYWKRIIEEAERYRRPFSLLNGMDRALFTLLPPAGRLARMTVIELVK